MQKLPRNNILKVFVDLKKLSNCEKLLKQHRENVLVGNGKTKGTKEERKAFIIYNFNFLTLLFHNLTVLSA